MGRRSDRFAAALHIRGIRDSLATSQSEAFALSDAALDGVKSVAGERVSVWVPGRIEVFGKHTDYAGGRSLLAAVERGFCVRVAPRSDGEVHVFDALSGRACRSVLRTDAAAPDGDWSNYVTTVARRVAQNFPEATCGVDIAFSSDLPQAAGLSSSSALVTAVFTALAAVNELSRSPRWSRVVPTATDLAGYLGAMENGFSFHEFAGDVGVGTLGGCQDHTAIVCAHAGTIVDYRWMPVHHVGSYALPLTHCFAVASSGVVAEKAAGARERYNHVSLMVRHLLSAWNEQSGRSDLSLGAAAGSAPSAPAALRELTQTASTAEFSATALMARLDQFLLETYTLIPAAAAAMQCGDWSALGDAAARSQAAAERGLGNQTHETTGLVNLASTLGAPAASAFGAGFGGSVWALVERDRVDAFLVEWERRYRDQFPNAAPGAMFFHTGAGSGVLQWSDRETAA